MVVSRAPVAASACAAKPLTPVGDDLPATAEALHPFPLEIHLLAVRIDIFAVAILRSCS